MDPIAAALIYILDWWVKTCKSHNTEPGISNISNVVLCKRSICTYEVGQMNLSHLKGSATSFLLQVFFIIRFPSASDYHRFNIQFFVAGPFVYHIQTFSRCTKTSTFDAILCSYSPHSILLTQEKNCRFSGEELRLKYLVKNFEWQIAPWFRIEGKLNDNRKNLK